MLAKKKKVCHQQDDFTPLPQPHHSNPPGNDSQVRILLGMSQSSGAGFRCLPRLYTCEKRQSWKHGTPWTCCLPKANTVPHTESCWTHSFFIDLDEDQKTFQFSTTVRPFTRSTHHLVPWETPRTLIWLDHVESGKIKAQVMLTEEAGRSQLFWTLANGETSQ